MPDEGARVPSLWAVGDVVAGQYEVTDVHTDGGMGVVYRVRHREWDADLAVKCPRPELFRTPAQQEVFVREAETWVSLGLHPHVCGCHYVRVMDGVPRVFAEYVPGGSLHSWIRDRRLYAGGPAESLPRILDLAVQTAWGLDHAHERGLVHQDVKPANVLLDADGTAKVTDFGLARARAAEGGELVPGGGMTMAYASPEQAAGAPLSRRTDIYSFAVSVLEMFTGEVTWLMGPIVGEALAAHLAEHRNGQARSSHPGDGPPALPDAVAALLARCLEQEPAHRPGTMAEVARELRAVYRQLTGREFPRPQPRAAELRADELNNRGLSLLDLGRTTEAGEAFAAALAVDPRHPEATYNAGLAQWRRGATTDEELVSALEAARADAVDTARVQPLLDEVHRERGALGSGPGPDAGSAVREVPWYDYEQWVDSPRGRTRRAEPGMEIRLSRDGRLALTACDGKVRLWDVTTGRRLRELDDMRGAVDLGPDGRQATCVGSDGLVRLWDLVDGRCVRTFTPHYRSGSTAVRSTRLLPRPGLVLAGTSDGTVLGWDLSTGRIRYVQEGFHHGAVEATADGRLLLFHTADGVVSLRDPDGTAERTTLPVRSVTDFPLCHTPDGRTAAAAPFDGAVHLWTPGSGEPPRTFDGTAVRLDLSPDGRLLAGGGRDGAVRLWETATGRCLRTYRGHRAQVEAVVFVRDGKHLLSAGRDGTARRWRLPEPHAAAVRLSRPRPHDELNSLHSTVAALVADAERARHGGRCAEALELLTRARATPGHERAAEALTAWRALARDPRVTRTGLRAAWPSGVLARFDSVPYPPVLSTVGRTVAVRLGSTLHLLDLDSGERGPVIEGLPDTWGRVVQLTADGATVLTSSQDGSLGAWSVTTGKRLASLRLTLGAGGTRFSADGRLALVRGADDRVSLWDLASGACLRTLDGDHGWDPALWLAPDGHTAAVSGAEHTVQLWDLDEGRCRRVLRGHTAPVQAIHVDTERKRLLSCAGRGDSAIRLWDIETGACLRKFDAQPGEARTLRLTSDGRFALSCGADGALRVWDVATGRCLRVLHGPQGGFNDVVLGQDESSALSSGADGSVQLWVMDWELAVAAAPERPPARNTEKAREATVGFGQKNDRHTAGSAAELRPLLRAVVEITGNPQLDTLEARRNREARGGDTDAMVRLGVSLLDEGRGDEAEQQFRRAAELGSPLAMKNLAVVLRQLGRNAEAAQWQRRSADLGYAPAMTQEGFRAAGENRIEEAERWLRGAAEQGDVTGMLALGMVLRDTGRDQEAEKWLRGAADKGEPSAMYSLAHLMQKAGRHPEAEQWYRRSADKGEPQAMNNLGNILRHSDRGAEAEQWYRRSAEAGEPMGMLNLGEVLESSRPQEAAQWYRKAAAKGAARAEQHLSRMRASGLLP